MRAHTSWGRLPLWEPPALTVRLKSPAAPLPEAPAPMLAYGMGRSYGDVCLNPAGTLVETRALDHLLAFDAATGVLRCEAGATLGEVITWSVPRGWFLPVVPGTQFVTVGGAIANDVHGKNHHVAGTFGGHVRCLALARSDGSVHELTPQDPLFRATVGGLGLTGVILWADVALQPIETAQMDAETLRFRSLEEFFALSVDSAGWPYTVAWVDATAARRHLGRGHFIRGRHAPRNEGAPNPAPSLSRATAWRLPFDAPSVLTGRPVARAFNALYFHRLRRDRIRAHTWLRPFFFPLDAVSDWNRLYGRQGFYQYQFVVPTAHGQPVVHEVLTRVERSGQAALLAVLKVFGDVRSPGLLSFPRPGVTLALDLPNSGASTRALLDTLDAVVLEAGGALYPAKDARMSPATFRASFPALDAFTAHVDPAFSSAFWRRVHG